VRTTELNLTSDEATIEKQNFSWFRRRDIKAVIGRLEEAGHEVEPVDWSTGRV
jgi:hypothetical protein